MSRCHVARKQCGNRSLSGLHKENGVFFLFLPWLAACSCRRALRNKPFSFQGLFQAPGRAGNFFWQEKRGEGEEGLYIQDSVHVVRIKGSSTDRKPFAGGATWANSTMHLLGQFFTHCVGMWLQNRAKRKMANPAATFFKLSFFKSWLHIWKNLKDISSRLIQTSLPVLGRHLVFSIVEFRSWSTLSFIRLDFWHG